MKISIQVGFFVYLCADKQTFFRIMASDVFHFRQFDVAHDKCAMRVGTDGVLLGAWCSLPDVPVLDIGTGTGLISLMIAQRLSENGKLGEGCIEAVEIDADAAAQAVGNFEGSPWAPAFRLHHVALQEFATDRRFGLIVCNPPFYNATLKPDSEARAVARHNDALPLDCIMKFAGQHLLDEGRLALVYPMDYDTEVMTSAVLACLKPVRICNVLTKEGKPCKRRLAEFALQASAASLLSAETLMLHGSDGEYTTEYRALTEAFYVSLR